jgi:hypothetical protein
VQLRDIYSRIDSNLLQITQVLILYLCSALLWTFYRNKVSVLVDLVVCRSFFAIFMMMLHEQLIWKTQGESVKKRPEVRTV